MSGSFPFCDNFLIWCFSGTTKRATDFPVIYDCDNASYAPQILAIVQDLAKEIVPNAPNLNLVVNPASCSVGVSSSDPTTFDPVGVIVGVVVGVILALCIIGLIIYKLLNRSQLHNLPRAINWSYKLYEKTPFTWTKRGTSESHYFFKVHPLPHSPVPFPVLIFFLDLLQLSHWVSSQAASPSSSSFSPEYSFRPPDDTPVGVHASQTDF